MSHEKKRLWIASIDGELSAREAADFHQTISPAERALVELEITFESEVARRLRDGADCPAEMWRRVDGRAREHIRARSGSFTSLRPFRWAAAAAVAAAGFAGALYLGSRAAPVSADVLAAAADVQSLSREARVEGDATRIQLFILASGFEIGLKDIPGPAESGGHAIRLLGAGLVARPDGNAVTVLVSCCGQPVRMILAKKGSSLAGLMAEAEGGEGVLGVRVIGEYVAAAVGRHGSADLLNLFG
jgi:hypothetical protein